MKRACVGLVLAAAGFAAGEPPKLVVPAEVRPASGYARMLPDTTAKAVTYVGLSGVHPFPGDELKDGRRFLLPTGGLKAGRYKFVAVGSLKDEHAVAEFVVVVGDAPAPPDPPGPGPTPDPTPDPAPKADAAYLAVVRDSANIPPAAAAVLGDTPFWDSLKAKGHEWDFYDDADAAAKAKGYLRLAERVQSQGAAGYTPALVVLDLKTGRPLKVVPLPATTAAVAALLGEVTK